MQETVFERPPGDFDNELMPIRRVMLDNARTVPLDIGRPERIARPISCQDVGRLQMPVRVVHGTETNRWWQFLARRYAHCASAPAASELTGVRHDGPIRRPLDLAALIQRFTREFEAGRAAGR